MSVLEKIRQMSAAQPVSQQQALQVTQPEDAEIKLRRKAGVLAAFGLVDKAIADTLFLSLEQVIAIRETVEFKESCAKQTYERTQRLIDLEEGIEAVETQSVAKILYHLQCSSDPDFALRAFAVSNRAVRRAPASVGRVIDASNVGNVITLTVNKNYITNVSGKEGGKSAVIELQGRQVEEIPRKASDISSPKRLSEILQVGEKRTKEQEIVKAAETIGMSLDELDEIFDT